MFLAADIVQRTLVVLAVRVFPRMRERVLTAWVRVVNRSILGVIRVVGGARIGIAARIPFEASTLVLMNHQSLLDIPVVIACVDGGYPAIVTRERYARGYPLISHMVRLYGHPTVRPGELAGGRLEALKRAAEAAARPLVIYPEGTRSRDGGIRPFKKGGLAAILGVRSWTVHVVVGDGMFSSADLAGFVRRIGRTTIRAESVGPFRFDHRRDDAESFIAEMEGVMSRKLAEMRSSAAAS